MERAGHAPRNWRSEASIEGIAWAPDGRRIATGCQDSTAQVWDAASGRHLLSYHGHKEGVNVVAWGPGGKQVASGSDDGTVQIWSASGGSHLLTYRGHTTIEVENLAWSPDGTRIASIDEDNAVHVWDSASGKTLYTHPGQYRLQQYHSPLAWSPDGTRLVSPFLGENRRGAHIWNAETGETLVVYQHEGYLVQVIAWSPDGRYIASSSDGVVHLWDARNGSQVFSYRGHVAAEHGRPASVTTLAWSPDGNRIASFSGRAVRVWSARSGETLSKHHCDFSWRIALAWSPDSRCLAVGGENKTVQVWRIGQDAAK